MDLVSTIIHGLAVAVSTLLAGLSIALATLGIAPHAAYRTPTPSQTTQPTAVATTTASTTLPALEAPATSTTPLPATAVVTTATTKLKTATPPTDTTPVAQTVASAPTNPTPSQPTKSPNQINLETRAAVVNILCITSIGGYLNPISGSGVIIDSRGIILTNAHVAQYLLLKDYPTKDNISCTIRTGSPAQNAYTTELLYLNPDWITENASKIDDEIQLGTGEHDYALLRIVGTTNPGGTLPPSFPALPMSASIPDTGDAVLVDAYPAGFLDGTSIQNNLYSSSAFTTVSQLFTFDNPNNIDVIALKGSVVAQAGSSGGAVADGTNGNLIGLISTEITSSTTDGRTLNAITLNYIDRSLSAKGFGGIIGILSGNIEQTAAQFNRDIAPLLAGKLIKALTPR